MWEFFWCRSQGEMKDRLAVKAEESLSCHRCHGLTIETVLPELRHSAKIEVFQSVRQQDFLDRVVSSVGMTTCEKEPAGIFNGAWCVSLILLIFLQEANGGHKGSHECRCRGARVGV